MKNTQYQVIFNRLVKLGVNMNRPDQTPSKSKSAGYMDLHFDYLGHENGAHVDSFTIALAHRFLQNGDSMADPDMEIRVYPKLGWAEALSYELSSMGIYHRVYDGNLVNLRQKREQNDFLRSWLKNAMEQGHTFIQADDLFKEGQA